MYSYCSRSSARPAPPPLEIYRVKKKVIRGNFKLFHLCFATFSLLFSELSNPPPYKIKKEESLSDSCYSHPPLGIPGHSPDAYNGVSGTCSSRKF